MRGFEISKTIHGAHYRYDHAGLNVLINKEDPRGKIQPVCLQDWKMEGNITSITDYYVDGTVSSPDEHTLDVHLKTGYTVRIHVPGPNANMMVDSIILYHTETGLEDIGGGFAPQTVGINQLAAFVAYLI